jgi:hypothetical protein
MGAVEAAVNLDGVEARRVALEMTAVTLEPVSERRGYRPACYTNIGFW